MKKTSFLLMAAIVAVTLMQWSCTPEEAVLPVNGTVSSTGSSEMALTPLTTLTGTQWTSHFDYEIPHWGIHVVKDVDYTFLTDSTGTRRAYANGQGTPAVVGDTTFPITYKYNPVTNIAVVVDVEFGKACEVKYSPLLGTLTVLHSDPLAVFTRVW
ncbi:MAG: hypothetical protein IK058_00740 [Bacteroidales bacterium]|nr:hypothetical protein [Bacteroidales bacterium]